MKLRLISWNGHNINDGVSYDAADQTPQMLTKTDAVFVQRQDEYEKYSGMEFGHKTMLIGIAILGDFYSLRDQLKAWFDEDRKTPKELLAQDIADSNKQWYMKGVCVDLIEEGHILTAILEMEETFWRQKIASTLSWDVTTSPQTQNVTVGGTVNAKPILTITAKTTKSGDYAWKSFIAILNQTTRAMPDYYLDVSGQTGKQLNSSALVSGGKLQNDGDDLRLWLNGKEIYRWLTGINTTTTGLHTAEIPLSAGIMATLSGAIASSGAVATITVKVLADNKTALQKLKTVANKVIAIKTGSAIEIFTFTDTNPDKFQITGVTRAQKLTGMIAHNDNDKIYWVEHDCYMLYGNSTVSAPEVDANRQPMQDLANSTNNAWVWMDFYDENAARPGAWQKQLLKSVGGMSAPYTATQGGAANPASVMGAKIAAYMSGIYWKSETAAISWMFYDPSGIVSVILGGQKYRSDGSWPALASLQKSTNLTAWSSVGNESKGGIGIWEALITLTGTKSLSGTYQAIRFYFSGSVGGSANNEADIEFDNITINKDSATVPLIFISTENANYMYNELIENLTTGESMTLSYHGALNADVVIDTQERTIKYADGTSILGALTRTGEWFSLKAGVTNQIRVTDSGIARVTHKLDWENRGL